MNERELLERAAKAAGITILSTYDGVFRNCTGFGPQANLLAAPPWNPLTDDGDAFRLAVALRMDIASFTHGVRVNRQDGDDCHETYNTDPYAATRRAIVRAAASLA